MTLGKQGVVVNTEWEKALGKKKLFFIGMVLGNQGGVVKTVCVWY
jgi:hypothetical protein